jgi:hypothetical protein
MVEEAARCKRRTQQADLPMPASNEKLYAGDCHLPRTVLATRVVKLSRRQLLGNRGALTNQTTSPLEVG